MDMRATLRCGDDDGRASASRRGTIHRYRTSTRTSTSRKRRPNDNGNDGRNDIRDDAVMTDDMLPLEDALSRCHARRKKYDSYDTTTVTEPARVPYGYSYRKSSAQNRCKNGPTTT
eukprot:scaffold190322_cov27-Prasinocladus_malaysianus.AAC.1